MTPEKHPNKGRWVRLYLIMLKTKQGKYMMTLPNNHYYLSLLTQLILLAGETNDGGQIYIAKNIPYTLQTLAVETKLPEHILSEGLALFKDFEWVDLTDDFDLYFPDWILDQNTEEIEKKTAEKRAGTLERVRRHREKKRLERLEREKMQLSTPKSVTQDVTRYNGVTVALRNANVTHLDIDLERDIDATNSLNASLAAAKDSDMPQNPKPAAAAAANKPKTKTAAASDRGLWLIDQITELRPKYGTKKSKNIGNRGAFRNNLQEKYNLFKFEAEGGHPEKIRILQNQLADWEVEVENMLKIASLSGVKTIIQAKEIQKSITQTSPAGDRLNKAKPKFDVLPESEKSEIKKVARDQFFAHLTDVDPDGVKHFQKLQFNGMLHITTYWNFIVSVYEEKYGRIQ